MLLLLDLYLNVQPLHYFANYGEMHLSIFKLFAIPISWYEISLLVGQEARTMHLSGETVNCDNALKMENFAILCY